MAKAYTPTYKEQDLLKDIQNKYPGIKWDITKREEGILVRGVYILLGRDMYIGLKTTEYNDKRLLESIDNLAKELKKT